jgi:hypothetical protein
MWPLPRCVHRGPSLVRAAGPLLWRGFPCGVRRMNAHKKWYHILCCMIVIQKGGAMFVQDGAPQITDSTFEGNTAVSRGRQTEASGALCTVILVDDGLSMTRLTDRTLLSVRPSLLCCTCAPSPLRVLPEGEWPCCQDPLKR